MRTTSASIYDRRMEAGIGGEGGGFGKNALAWLGLGGSVGTWRVLSQIQPHCFSYLLYIPVIMAASAEGVQLEESSYHKSHVIVNDHRSY